MQGLNLKADVYWLVLEWTKASVFTIDSTLVNVGVPKIPITFVIAISGDTAGTR